MTRVSRRDFLKYSGLAVGGVLASRYFVHAQSESDKTANPIRSFKVVRSTCSPNDTGACGMLATVQDGRIVSLIQSADYPEADYNPRGCLRGLSFSKLIYGPDRLKHPLIRVGKRGEGKFRVASWDEALDYVAEKLVTTMQNSGPDSVGVSIQVAGTGYAQKGALVRLSSMFGWSLMHGYPMNGDLPMFWPMTFGVQSEEFESLEWLNSRYIAIFGSNMMVSRVPDSKFLNLAREKGAKVVVVDPNYSPTAAKADEWVPINPGTDAALALGIVNVIITKGLYDAEFIRTFTDMPLLVRMDNQKRLIASEVSGIKESAEAIKTADYRTQFVVFDQNSQKFAFTNPERLDGSLKPALEGEFEVELTGGQKVKVKPVFQLIKDMVTAEYTPEKAAEIVAPEIGKVQEYVRIINKMGLEMATTKPLHLIYGASNYQWFHGDLKGRALSLIVALTGNIGRSGAGISTYAGQYKVRWPLAAWWNFRGRKVKYTNFLLWLNDEYRHSDEYTRYNGGVPYPKNGIKALVFGWNNLMDQHNMSNRIIEKAASGELDLIVACDFQMTTSCLWADVVLPGVSWYEKHDITATSLHPYVQLQQPAIEPLFECMPEVWIYKEIARRLAPRWNDAELKDNISEFYPDTELFQQEESARTNGSWNLELAREIADKAILSACDLILKKGGPLVEGITLDQLTKGPIRLNMPTPDKRQIPFWEQINKGTPFPPVSFPAALADTARFVKSGRIEFYKDENVFIDFKEELPVHKAIFADTEYQKSETKDKYPFAYLTRNSLYRVHSTHSNNITLLELQDFKPRVSMNPVVGKEKGFKEGDLVKAFNDRGEVIGYAAFEAGLHPGIIVVEQGWWSRYLHGSSYNSLIFPWIKSTHMIYFTPGIWEPSTAWNEAACDVVKV